MIASLMVALLLTGVRDNNASPTGAAHMTFSKMRMADLESTASGYEYNQQGSLPVSYVRYTNHGSGRYYHAPAPVHYVVGSPAPVAPAVSETTLPHEPVLLAYATTKHEIAPYAVRQPYPRNGFINYGASQLAKYAQPLEPLQPPKLVARAPYYTPDAFEPNEMNRNIDKRNDDEKADDYSENGRDDDDDKVDDSVENVDQYRVTENHEKATHPIDALDHPRPNIDVSLELSDDVKYSVARNSAHGEKGDRGYSKQNKFDAGEHGWHDKSRQQGHYDTETENKKGYSNTNGNYGRRDEAEKGEKGSSYERTSYHKKGHKTSGFHKIYRKDEYKKDTDFYDESHKKGYFDKHSTSEGRYNAAEGESEKSEQHESGFDSENHGKKGFYDKGHIRNRDQGYNKEKGEDFYHENYENHDSDNDTRLTEKHGHEKSDRRH